MACAYYDSGGQNTLEYLVNDQFLFARRITSGFWPSKYSSTLVYPNLESRGLARDIRLKFSGGVNLGLRENSLYSASGDLSAKNISQIRYAFVAIETLGQQF